MGLLMIFISHKIMRPNFTLVLLGVYYLCNSIIQILHVHSFELPISSTSCPSIHQKYCQPMTFAIFSFSISCSLHFFPSKHNALHFNPNSLHKDSSTLLLFFWTWCLLSWHISLYILSILVTVLLLYRNIITKATYKGEHFIRDLLTV